MRYVSFLCFCVPFIFSMHISAIAEESEDVKPKVVEPEVVELLCVQRTTCPPGFSISLNAFGVCVFNNSSMIARNVKVLYDRLVPIPWKGPTSLPSKGWKPEEEWSTGHKLTVNCMVLPQTKLYLMSRPSSDYTYKIRIKSIQLYDTPYEDPVHPLSKLAKEQIVAENKGVPAEFLFMKIFERHAELSLKMEKEDPEKLKQMDESVDIWFNGIFSTGIDRAGLQDLVTKDDPQKYKDTSWEFVDIPIEFTSKK